MTVRLYPDSVNTSRDFIPACNYISYCLAVKSNQNELIPFINDVFFGGGYQSPKSWKDIKTIHIPYASAEGENVVLKRKRSFQAVLGYVEGIPVLGTALAILGLVRHFFLAVRVTTALNHAVSKWDDAIYEPGSAEERAKLAADVVNAALSCALQGQLLWGSTLSLVPLLKPVTRILQVAAFHLRKGPIPA